jgi:hypothetical protein
VNWPPRARRLEPFNSSSGSRSRVESFEHPEHFERNRKGGTFPRIETACTIARDTFGTLWKFKPLDRRKSENAFKIDLRRRNRVFDRGASWSAEASFFSNAVKNKNKSTSACPGGKWPTSTTSITSTVTQSVSSGHWTFPERLAAMCKRRHHQFRWHDSRQMLSAHDALHEGRWFEPLPVSGTSPMAAEASNRFLGGRTSGKRSSRRSSRLETRAKSTHSSMAGWLSLR